MPRLARITGEKAVKVRQRCKNHKTILVFISLKENECGYMFHGFILKTRGKNYHGYKVKRLSKLLDQMTLENIIGNLGHPKTQKEEYIVELRQLQQDIERQPTSSIKVLSC